MKEYFRFDQDFLNSKKIDPVAYKKISPFPHAIIDNFLPEEFINRIIDELPKSDDIQVRDNKNTSGKSALYRSENAVLGDATYNVVSEMNSAPFLEFLQQVTGINGIIPDPYLHCGGIHQTRKHGYLGVHADYNHLGELRLDRRINCLLYLNKEWHPSWEGYLELWDKEMKNCEQKIEPIANRLAIFSTTDYSYHGHMIPLNVPEDVTRNSLAVYYYSSGRPKGEVNYKNLSTIYVHPKSNKSKQKNFMARIINGVKQYIKNHKRMRNIKRNIT